MNTQVRAIEIFEKSHNKKKNYPIGAMEGIENNFPV